MARLLFRREALDAYGRRWLGEVVVGQPRLGFAYALLGLFSVVALALTLAFAEYRGHESARGVVGGVASLRQVTSPTDGVVIALKVEEGQAVADRAILATVGSERTSPEGALPLTQQRSELLRRQESVLTKQRDSIAERSLRAKRDIDAQIAQTSDEINLRSARHAGLIGASRRAAAVVEEYSNLHRQGFVSLLQVEEKARAALEAETAALEQHHKTAELQRQLTQLRGRQLRVQDEADAEATNLDARILELREAIVTLEGNARVDLVSPIAGVVEAISVRQGMEVKAGQELIVLRGHSALNEVRLSVSSAAAAMLRLGTTLEVSVLSKPQRRFGRVLGTVQSISRLPLAEREPKDSFSVRHASAGRFEVRLTLDSNAITDGDTSVPLRSGMDVEVDIPLERVRIATLIRRTVTGR